MLAVVALDDGNPALGGNGAALALLAAWAIRDVLARRRGREDDADLLGTLAIAVLLVLLPLATSDAHPLAGLVGGEGLGNWAVTYGYRQFDEVITWSALIVVVIVVQLIQALGNWLARRIMRR